MYWKISVVFTLLIHLVYTKIGIVPHDVNIIENNKNRNEDNIQFRLPNSTIPLAYNIMIETWIHDNNNFRFHGHVSIELSFLQNITEIVLHARQLNIIDATLTYLSNNLSLAINQNETTDFLTLTLTNPDENILENTVGVINIEYEGYLRNDSAGFYQTSYINNNGEIIYLATTQFQSTDARHAFPCFDEPAFKAHFTISIIHGAALTAISNMPGSSEVHTDGRHITRFSTTPLMSTYLIAFVISDFENLANNVTGNQLPHRAFARPNAINETALSLQIGEEMLTELEEYFGISYPLPKMDQIAIPNFPWGGMENWGLITYREEYFFWNDGSNYVTKSWIYLLIAHEMAHNWFGNLVSPKWWTYLWINEGFATLYEYYAIDMINPRMHMMDFFVVDALQFTFISDALETTRPMTFYAEHPDAVEDLFDTVAYFKSSCVLRMMQYALTENSFRKGLSYFLQQHAYGSVDEFDLYVSLQEAVTEDNSLPDSITVEQIMTIWSSQAGFPVLLVNRNYEMGTINITQTRYMSNTSAPPNFHTWWIPYNFVTAQNYEQFAITIPQDWLRQGERTRIIQQTEDNNWESNDWIIFNKQQTGYYRVLYDDQNYNLIAEELNNGELDRIHPLSRSQLIDDAFNFARTNRLNYNTLFDMIKYLHHEHEFIPWASAINGFSYINRMLEGSENYHLFTDFLQSILFHFYDTVGFEDEDAEEIHLLKYGRTLAIDWMCRMGNEECLTMANNTLWDYVINSVEIHPNLRSTLFCAGLRHESNTKFTNLYNRMTTSTINAERLQIISSLGCTQNVVELQNYIHTAFNVNIEQHSMNERIQIINSVYQNNRIGLQVTVQYLTNNIGIVNTVLGSNLNGIIIGLSNYMTNEPILHEFNFLVMLARERNYITEDTVTRSNTIIEENNNWINAHRQTIVEWLENNNAAPPGSANNIILSSFILILLLSVSFISIMRF